MKRAGLILLLLAALTGPARDDAVIRTAEGLRAARRDRLSDRPFELEGRVVIPSPYPFASLHVEIDGADMDFYDLRTNRSVQVGVGDRVIVSGVTQPSSDTSRVNANCREIRILSHGVLPPLEPPLAVKDFRARETGFGRRTAVRGTIRDVFPDDIDATFAYITLQDGRDFVYLVYNGPAESLSGFRALRGCEVVAEGIAGRGIGEKTRYLGQNLIISGTNAIRVVKRAGHDLFHAPELPAGRLTDLRIVTSDTVRRVRGTVVARWRGDTFLLRTAYGQPVEINLAEGPLPAVRTAVEAVGYPETDLYDISLKRAVWRPSDAAPAEDPVPKDETLQSLFTTVAHARPMIAVAAHGQVLRVRGWVKSIALDERGERRFLLTDGDFAIAVDCESAPDVFDDVREGCLVEVVAVCIRVSDVWRPSVTIPRIRGLFLVLRNRGDVRVLAHPSWWTPARLLLALALLVVLLVAILAWNVTLRRLVERRSREVIRAQERKLESELRLRERTRLAAEIHDTLAQNLTVVAYQVSAAKTACANRGCAAAEALGSAAKMLKSFRTDLRRCLWDLRNDVLDEPDFAEAVRKTVTPVTGGAALAVRFAGQRDLISDPTAHALLCVLRELVANAVLHGHATHVRIAGESRRDGIALSVRDDGTGFDPRHRPGADEGHFGLDGIGERLRRLGGAFEIESAPGQGTYARLSVPPVTEETTEAKERAK